MAIGASTWILRTPTLTTAAVSFAQLLTSDMRHPFRRGVFLLLLPEEDGLNCDINPMAFHKALKSSFGSVSLQQSTPFKGVPGCEI